MRPFLCFGNVRCRGFFLSALALTAAVTTLSSFQGYRKTQSVTADCLMTDTKGTKRALITSSPVRSCQRTSGETARGADSESTVQRCTHPGFSCVIFPQQVNSFCALIVFKTHRTTLTGNLAARNKRNCHGFWWRVFALEYSRNIWCELVVIVDFRETTVCLVKTEQGGFDGKEMFKRF